MSVPDVIANRFTVEKLIGQGGMGEVYLGRDVTTGEPVAIKRLKPELLNADPDLVTRFVQEGEALRQLNHPNIVRMLAAANHNHTHYLILEYVAGGSLHDHLEKHGPLSISLVLAIALDLADALTRAHRLNIIHRDLKPANVLLADDGTPRLTDFGTARLLHNDGLTQSGVLVGTMAYLSPEACSGEKLDARTDIWAFGALLFEMLTGRAPFQGNNIAATLKAILTEPTPDLHHLRPDVSDALADLIYRMLAKDRQQRLPSIRLAGAELEAMLADKAAKWQSGKVPVNDDGTVVDNRPFAASPHPPIAVSPTQPHNLPTSTTPFVGREVELANLAQLLADPQVRLVTITGPGGMGKTSLALAAAAKQLESTSGYTTFPHGLYFVPLAPLSDVDAIVAAIAEAIGFTFYEGAPPQQQLLDTLREKQLLLILDNFEHLLEGATLVDTLLQTAPGVKLLATSRERLNRQSEHLLRLAGMDFPDWETPEDAAAYSAVQLFLQSARRVQPDYTLTGLDLAPIARICRLVQGLPLGIVLAAAWLELLSAEEIAQEISQSLDFLETDMADVPERQRSIRAVFDYSWRLLTPEEQTIFPRLSVFRGGFSREAAQAITGASLRTLLALVNKSLLHRTPEGRFEIHELLRQYAADHLTDAATTRTQHSQFYLTFLHQRESALERAGQLRALQEIDLERENVRVAWEWAVEQGALAPLGQALPALMTYLHDRGRYPEGMTMSRYLTQKLATLPTSLERDPLLIRALIGQASFTHTLGQATESETLQKQALALLEGLPSHEIDLRSLRAFVLGSLAAAPWVITERQVSLAYAEESLALYRAVGDLSGEARTLGLLAFVKTVHNEAAVGQQDGLQALALYRQLGDQYGLMDTLHKLSIATPDAATRRPYLEECLTIAERLGDTGGAARALFNLSLDASAMGHFAAALGLVERSLTLAHDLGSRQDMARGHMGRGFVHLHLGQYELARQDATQAIQYGVSVNYTWVLVNSYLLQLAAAVGLADWETTAQPPDFTLPPHLLERLQNATHPYTTRAYLTTSPTDAASLPDLLHQVQDTIEQKDDSRLQETLANLALYLVQRGELAAAQQLYAFVKSLPEAAHSQWFADVWGQHIPGPLPEPEEGDKWQLAAAWLEKLSTL